MSAASVRLNPCRSCLSGSHGVLAGSARSIRLGGDKPPLIVFNGKRRQNPAPVSARVDCDAVAPLFDLLNNRVAVHDYAAVLLGVVEEGLSNPTQVGAGLLLDRDAGANPGVHEKIVAE